MRLAALLALAAPPAAALDLAFPLGCALGGTCFVQNGFDQDPGPSARDALRGPLNYDGHDGTDLALPTLAEQAAGVDVLAAAPGVVAAARGGEAVVLQGARGGRAGDVVRLAVEGLDGAPVVRQEEALERTQARLFRAAGLRAPEGGWPSGRLEGTATLLRDGEVVATREAEATLA